MASVQNPYTGPDAAGFQKFHDDNYQRVVAGYQQMATQQQTMADMINNRWEDLYKQQAAYGASQYADLEGNYKQNLANTQQQMASRGLFSTTGAMGAELGANDAYQRQRLALGGDILGHQNQIRQGQLGWQDVASQQLQGIYGQRNQYLGQYQQQGLGLGIQQGIDYNQRVQQQRMQAAGIGSQEQLQAAQLQNQLQMQQNAFRQSNYQQREFNF